MCVLLSCTAYISTFYTAVRHVVVVPLQFTLRLCMDKELVKGRSALVGGGAGVVVQSQSKLCYGNMFYVHIYVVGIRFI